MIGIAPEAQLIAAAVLFYLYDACVLLYANEGLVLPMRDNRWRIVYQPNTLALRGRLAYIPEPFVPHRPIYRLAWSAPAISFDDATDWTELRGRYRALVPFVYGAAAAIFVLLPFALFASRSDGYVLASAAAIYLVSISAGLLVVRRRSVFGLSRRKAWSTALECLLCPPFTVNLVRRLSLIEPVESSLPAAGRHLLDTPDWNELRARLILAQEEAIEDAVSEQSRAALIRARATLVEANGHERD